MKLSRLPRPKWLLAMFLSLLACQASAENQDVPLKDGAAHLKKDPAPDYAYHLKQGDTIEVSVWREDNLIRKLRILPDGSITFPLIGRIEVAGLDTTQVEEKIAERLGDYIEEPVVNVVIENIEGNRVYILGKVMRPGPIILDAPLTVLQALSLVGGLDKFADEDAIKVLRYSENGVTALSVRYGDLIKARDLSSNIALQAGDTIIVP